MQIKRVLAIDDVRNHEADIIARTFKDGINHLKNSGPFDKLILDHDLGEVELQRTEDGQELTGYHIMLFLEENPEYAPNEIVCCSSNPPGRARIEVVIEKLKRQRKE